MTPDPPAGIIDDIRLDYHAGRLDREDAIRNIVAVLGGATGEAAAASLLEDPLTRKLVQFGEFPILTVWNATVRGTERCLDASITRGHRVVISRKTSITVYQAANPRRKDPSVIARLPLGSVRPLQLWDGNRWIAFRKAVVTEWANAIGWPPDFGELPFPFGEEEERHIICQSILFEVVGEP